MSKASYIALLNREEMIATALTTLSTDSQSMAGALTLTSVVTKFVLISGTVGNNTAQQSDLVLRSLY